MSYRHLEDVLLVRLAVWTDGYGWEDGLGLRDDLRLEVRGSFDVAVFVVKPSTTYI